MKHIFSAKKFSLALVAAVFMMASCKKDDSVSSPGTPTSTKLKKVSGDNHEVEFGYDGNGKLQSVTMNDELVTGGTTTTYTISYAGSKIAELKGNDQSRIIAQYTGDNITSAETKDGSGATVYTTEYSYANGQLKSALVETSFGFAMKFSFTTDANGNTTRSDVSMFNPATNQFESAGFTTYQFDGKANPLYEFRSLMALFLQPTSKNNVVKEMEHDEQGALSETIEYSYTYNDKNLPKSAVVKTTPVGGTATTSGVSYIYQ